LAPLGEIDDVISMRMEMSHDCLRPAKPKSFKRSSIHAKVHNPLTTCACHTRSEDREHGTDDRYWLAWRSQPNDPKGVACGQGPHASPLRRQLLQTAPCSLSLPTHVAPSGVRRDRKRCLPYALRIGRECSAHRFYCSGRKCVNASPATEMPSRTGADPWLCNTSSQECSRL
jgi:hypothetical protein